MNFTIEELYEAHFKAAKAEWEKVVKDFDPGQVATPDVIYGYFVANGWAGWNGGTYTENGKTSWCGHFAGAMGQRVGAYLGMDGAQVVFPIGLDPLVARFCYPSTRRLGSSAKWVASGTEMPVIWRPSPDGKVKSTDGQVADSWSDIIKQGMTLTVETSGNAPFRVGDHVVLADKIVGEDLYTVEGNGNGFFPDGTWGEGVVVRDERKPRKVADIRMALELKVDEHYEDWRPHK